METTNQSRSRLWMHRFAFSVGHFLNDLCASMWFSYLLVYFHKVLQFRNTMAGNLMLAGQIADGVATPLVGYESDRSGNLCRYGRRKTWHLVGTVCVVLSFPLIFMQCIGCYLNTPDYAKFIYYFPMIVIFQFGWASTQINHLALIPEIARDNAEKITLNAMRYAFTVLSSIFVYGLTWLILDEEDGKQKALGPGDAIEFRNIGLITVGTGLAFSILFHIGVRENDIQQRFFGGNKSETNVENEIVVTTEDETTQLIRANPQEVEIKSFTPMMVWTAWFTRPLFYQMGVLYMCTRLVVNLSQVYMPMYITDTLDLSKQYIAKVPLVMYLAGFIGALAAKLISNLVRNELVYIIGSSMVLAACCWAHFIPMHSNEIFGQAALLGCGNTIILVMCLGMVAEMIGENTETGAFVYGAMSLTDKISNGIAIIVIQYLNPCMCQCSLCGEYFKTIMSFLIGSILIIGLISVISYFLTKQRNQRILIYEEVKTNSRSGSSVN